jgi:hypothetical protein
LLGANGNCSEAAPQHPGGFADPVLAGPARKKKSVPPDDLDRIAPGCDGRGSDLRPAMDASLAPQDPKGVAATGHPADTADDRPAVASTPLQPADQPQTAGRYSRPGPRSAVPLPVAAAPAVHNPRPAGDQRRYEEEGVGRQLQEPGPVLAAAGPRRARPRLPELGVGAGDPGRRLRRSAQRRLCGRRHVARYPRLYRGGDPPVVAGG